MSSRHLYALYPGSFDPITNGHVDIVKRSLLVFQKITLVVATSGRKNSLLSVPERVALIQEVFKGTKGVSVGSCKGLIMDYALKHHANIVIRGLRAASDFEYEFMMAAMNKKLNSQVETFFMMTGQDLFFISSTMIKELFLFGANVSPYVPGPVWKYLKKKIKGR